MTDPLSILDRLEKLASEATPGPWRADRDHEIRGDGLYVAWGYHEDFGALCQKIKRADARLIAASRQALPALVKALRKALELIHPDMCSSNICTCEEILAELEALDLGR